MEITTGPTPTDPTIMQVVALNWTAVVRIAVYSFRMIEMFYFILRLLFNYIRAYVVGVWFLIEQMFSTHRNLPGTSFSWW